MLPSPLRKCWSIVERMLIQILSAGIVIWQKSFSKLFRQACRFEPTCSQYAKQALEKHGLFRGSWLSVLRILRCNPWFEGGEDPVPEARNARG